MYIAQVVGLVLLACTLFKSDKRINANCQFFLHFVLYMVSAFFFLGHFVSIISYDGHFSDGSFAYTNPFAADQPSVPLSTLLTLKIHSHVPIKLQFTPPNYTLSSAFFTTTIQSFGLTDHIDDTVDAR